MRLRTLAPVFPLALIQAFALPAPALADTLVDNVDGVTLDATGGVDHFTGLLVGDDGRIVQVLHRGDKRPGKVDYLVDGQGRFLMPGLIDSHAHVMSIGFAALTLDLSDTKSLAEAQARIAAYAREHPDRPWILGRGWNQEIWGLGGFPTAEELDAAVSDRPVWLERVDGHAGWANSRAMAEAGVTFEQLLAVLVAKGKYPAGTPLENIDPEIIDKFIFPHWDKFMGMINGGQAA